jgi:hypothetical protein
MVDEAYSSPYQRNASPFSSAGGSRIRDVFSASQDESASKRTRWTVMTAQQEKALASPTPSSASLSMRAPSFCDSSPANSDRGSVASRSQAFLHAIDSAAPHPASAPDFYHGGIPSSSPTSSHHSDYLPARFHQSSPGPGAALRRHDSAAGLVAAAAAEQPSVSTRPAKRGPSALQRASASGPPYGQGDPNAKPAYSYAALIGQALFSTPDLKMALADIYVWIMQLYPYFKKGESGWQNSIRHNLSLNPCFIKTVRGPENPGKGCLWQIKPGTEDQFVDGDFVRKGGQPPTRKSRGKKGKEAKGVEKVDPSTLLRSNTASSVSSGADSPAMMAAATLVAPFLARLVRSGTPPLSRLGRVLRPRSFSLDQRRLLVPPDDAARALSSVLARPFRRLDSLNHSGAGLAVRVAPPPPSSRRTASPDADLRPPAAPDHLPSGDGFGDAEDRVGTAPLGGGDDDSVALVDGVHARTASYRSVPAPLRAAPAAPTSARGGTRRC